VESDRERQGVIERVDQGQKVVESDSKRWGVIERSGEG